MDNQRLPILRVVQIDNEFERYVIQDQRDRVWTGERFDSQGAALFACHHHVATEVQSILKKKFEGLEPQRFVVPFVVEVFSHAGPVPVDQIAQYLSRASRLFVNTPEFGNGPGDSLVLSRIEWHQIEAEAVKVKGCNS